jgi:hypothetical protein
VPVRLPRAGESANPTEIGVCILKDLVKFLLPSVQETLILGYKQLIFKVTRELVHLPLIRRVKKCELPEAPTGIESGGEHESLNWKGSLVFSMDKSNHRIQKDKGG